MTTPSVHASLKRFFTLTTPVIGLRVHSSSVLCSLGIALSLVLVPLGPQEAFGAPSAQTATPSSLPEPSNIKTVVSSSILDYSGSGTWVKSASHWKWRLTSGDYLKNSWAQISGVDYYFDAAGIMASGWRYLDGWYHFASSGAKESGWIRSAGYWYFLDPLEGIMQTGFISTGGARYFLESNGAMSLGWVVSEGNWYYADPLQGGSLATSVRTLSDGTYTFESSGKMATGWTLVSGKWQYFASSGRRVLGWVLDQGNWFYLDPSSANMAIGWLALGGSWYWLDPSSGAMTTGWLRDGDAWYWLDPSSGAMATGTAITNGRLSRFDSSGRWISYIDQHPIIAQPSASQSSLIASMTQVYLNTGRPYPTWALSSGGAGDITAFVTILYEEAAAEGISPELVFCQVMKETGWLQFGGDVTASQFNFAGLGAVGGGAAGASFPSVRIGVRAQVQHLRAYADPWASSATLAYPLVDPRFTYVRKGSAPYIEYLGIQENPNGVGWATAKNYGYDLVSMMDAYF
ncbi:glucosaminidase domain-containing protein [Schaalia cardiffensis]